MSTTNIKSLRQKIQDIQQEIGKMSKDKKGYNYKYFDINQLLEVLKPLLHKHKVNITQPLTSIDGKAALELMVIDLETNQAIHSSVVLPENPDPQKMGSAITYFRRYAIQSFLLLEAEDDDAASVKTNAKGGKKINKEVQDNVL